MNILGDTIGVLALVVILVGGLTFAPTVDTYLGASDTLKGIEVRQ